MATTDIAIQEDVLTPEILARHVDTIIMGIPPYPANDEAMSAAVKAMGMSVIDEPSKALASQFGREISGHKRAALAHFKPWKAAADLLHSKICALEKATIEPYDRGAGAAGSKIVDYDDYQRRKREAEMRKAEEEARQKRLEEQRRMEAEAQAEAARKAEESRLARIEMEKAAAAGQAAEAERLRLEAESKAAEANEAIEQGIAAVQELEAEPIQVTLPPMPAPMKAQGMVTKKTYKGECVDLLALCRAAAENPQAYSQYLLPNEKMINAAVSRQGEAFNAPGIIVREVESTHFRSK